MTDPQFGPHLGRRTFIGTALATTALAGQTVAVKAREAGDAFVYEVIRTEEEWREMLEPIEYFVLRKRGTEGPRTSTLWNNTENGTYCCRGCDLTVYESRHKVELEKGWVFFRHSLPDTVLTGVDRPEAEEDDPFADAAAMLEVHCRRCGSHLGHIVSLEEVPGRPLHCINGFSLNFIPSVA